MARMTNRLTVRRVEQLSTKGIYADGNGLYLRVTSETSRSWSFVWHARGKRQEMGLGSTRKVSLAQARVLADLARADIADGVDPRAAKLPLAPKPTFGDIADGFIADRKDAVSVKSVDRWERSIGKNGYSKALRNIPVDLVTTDSVVEVLRPMWHDQPHSAGLLRGYIENVLSRAKVQGHRTGENPAMWRGHLEFMLPKLKRLIRGHHPALPYDLLPDFMIQLRQQDSMAAAALQLTILTATRTSEALNAVWEEFDLERAVWTIPANRMKAGREHRIPLSSSIVGLLRQLNPGEGHVFPGRKPAKPLSNMAMEMVLRRMEDRGDLTQKITVHGFRSTFRDWAGECTETPREVAEAALAHTVGNSAELAYRRGDALEKRRQLMDLWDIHCTGASNKHTALEMPEAANAA